MRARAVKGFFRNAIPSCSNFRVSRMHMNSTSWYPKETGFERAPSTVLPVRFVLLFRLRLRTVPFVTSTSPWIAPGLNRRGAPAAEVPPIAILAVSEATTTSIGRLRSIMRMVRMNSFVCNESSLHAIFISFFVLAFGREIHLHKLTLLLLCLVLFSRLPARTRVSSHRANPGPPRPRRTLRPGARRELSPRRATRLPVFVRTRVRGDGRPYRLLHVPPPRGRGLSLRTQRSYRRKYFFLVFDPHLNARSTLYT